MKCHISAFITAWFLAPSLLGAEVKLGPEMPLSPPTSLRAAAYDQTSPSAASNGADFLVAWSDTRRLDSDIYVTPVGRDGRPANPAGRRIASGYVTKVASAG